MKTWHFLECVNVSSWLDAVIHKINCKFFRSGWTSGSNCEPTVNQCTHPSQCNLNVASSHAKIDKIMPITSQRLKLKASALKF